MSRLPAHDREDPGKVRQEALSFHHRSYPSSLRSGEPAARAANPRRPGARVGGRVEVPRGQM